MVKLDNTLIILHSDHAQRMRTDVRIPLILRFPNGRRAGRISENVQNLDLAPTILDYLGLPVPEWMEGRSLISSPIDSRYPILSVYRRKDAFVKRDKWWEMDPAKVVPPFYSLGAVRANLCHRSYLLDLQFSRMIVSSIPGHTSPCPEGEFPRPVEVETLILEHLSSNGYDVSAIQTPVPKHMLAKSRDVPSSDRLNQ